MLFFKDRTLLYARHFFLLYFLSYMQKLNCCIPDYEGSENMINCLWLFKFAETYQMFCVEFYIFNLVSKFMLSKYMSNQRKMWFKNYVLNFKKGHSYTDKNR